RPRSLPIAGRPTASIETPATTSTRARHMAASTRVLWRRPSGVAGGRGRIGGVFGRARSIVMVTGGSFGVVGTRAVSGTDGRVSGTGSARSSGGTRRGWGRSGLGPTLTERDAKVNVTDNEYFWNLRSRLECRHEP